MSRTLRLCLVLLAAALAGMAVPASAQTAGVPASPSIVLTPNSGKAGQTLRVTLSGLRCRPDYRYTFEPQGVTAVALPCSPSSLDLAPAAIQVTISPNAPAGPYALLIAGRDMAPIRVPRAFTVRPAEPPAGRIEGAAPRVDRITPQDLAPGGTFTLTLYGSGFTQGMTVDFGRGICIVSRRLRTSLVCNETHNRAEKA